MIGPKSRAANATGHMETKMLLKVAVKAAGKSGHFSRIKSTHVISPDGLQAAQAAVLGALRGVGDKMTEDPEGTEQMRIVVTMEAYDKGFVWEGEHEGTGTISDLNLVQDSILAGLFSLGAKS